MDCTNGRENQNDERRQQFIRTRGYWADWWDDLIILDSEFFDAFAKYSYVPWEDGVLSPKLKELLYIAIDVNTTHMYEPGLRIHFRNAFQQGASLDEVLTVIQLASVMGVEAYGAAYGSSLIEAPRPDRDALGMVARESADVEDVESDALSEDRKPAFARAVSPLAVHALERLDATMYQAFCALDRLPRKRGRLSEQEVLLITLALKITVTNAIREGIQDHIDECLSGGISREEVLEVFRLVSVLGIHAATFGIPVLVEEARAAGQIG